jgi:hypothetical protein
MFAFTVLHGICSPFLKKTPLEIKKNYNEYLFQVSLGLTFTLVVVAILRKKALSKNFSGSFICSLFSKNIDVKLRLQVENCFSRD